MTLNQLECFMVLAQRLNFTQAADDLVMAQLTLS
ncbi:MAG: LysR family transcriptional regulator [Flavonifractor plautii]